MSLEDTTRPKKFPREDYDVISNKIGVLLSQRESLVRSWYSTPPAKIEEGFDDDDAVLFCNQPGHFGIGVSIPSNFLLLRSKILVARNTKDTNNKVTPMKNISRDGSSDEELGRSSLGRLKKQTQSRSAEKSLPDKMFSDETIRQNNEFLKSETLRNQSEFISDNKIDIRCTEEKSPTEEIKTGQADVFQRDKHLDEVDFRNKQKLTPGRIKAVVPKSVFGETYNINREEKKRMKKREKKKRQKLKAKSLNLNN
ncbi:hypothetical protein Golomagni_05631 [Golovinomyces magnicellulatus]|nr:hypothetical protein Golomagni_05631 [Golovinomyces magnicellulatus]